MGTLSEVVYRGVGALAPRINSLLCSPDEDSRKRPLVLVLRGVAGPMDGYVEIAQRVSGWGYHALVHNWQVRGNDPSDVDVQGDLAQAFEFINGRPSVETTCCAVMGFCRGGIHAFLASQLSPGVRASVIFHGFCHRAADEDHRLQPFDLATLMREPVLLLHGTEDRASPISDIRKLHTRLRSNGCHSELREYAGIEHGFAVSTHPGYSAAAAADSFERAREFLERFMRATPVATAIA